MEIYFCVGVVLIVFNIIFIVLTNKLKRKDFVYDENYKTKEFPYGFKLIGFIIAVFIFIFCFIIEYLSSGFLSFLLVPVIIGYPIYYYFLFICNHLNLKNLHKKEFFNIMFALVSVFYLLFVPFAEDVSLNHQLNLIISTNLPLMELGMIIYVNLFIYAVILNIVLYFDAYNFIIRKREITSQKFRKQHAKLSVISFIISGYIASIILNGQFLNYPLDFNFDKFQNIILIYQLFLSSIVVLLTLNNKKTDKEK